MFNTTLLRIFANQQYSTTFAGGTALNLYRDFLNDAQLNGPVSSYRKGPDISFTRNTFATFYNNTNTIQITGVNVPRFEYSPAGEPLGLLIEGQATNLVEYSTNFTGPTWLIPLSGITVTNNIPGITAPDQSETVTLITPTTSIGCHVISWTGAPSPPTFTSEYYTRSIFIKKETARYIVFSTSPEPSATAGGGNPDFQTVSNIFDFDTANFTQYSLLNTNIYPLNDGWYRIDIGRFSANTNTNRLTIGISNGPNFEDTYFDGSSNLSGVYIWGAQVEMNYNSTSYISTNGSQATRAEDNATISKNSFGAIYNPYESTFLIQAVRKNINTPNTFVNFTNSLNSKYWSLNSNLSSDIHSLTISTGITSLNTNTVVPNLSYRLVASLSADNFVLYQNNTFINQLTSGSIPTKPNAINQLQLGRFGSINYLNGHIHKFGYWPTSTNLDLSAL